jgi:hypothetical protein
MEQDNLLPQSSDMAQDHEQIVAQRRAAMQKLGKFSLYAAPVLLGAISKNADAQVLPNVLS